MRGKKPKERKNYILRTENGTLVEVTREVYLEWYQSRRREKYQKEQKQKYGVCSLEVVQEGSFVKLLCCRKDSRRRWQYAANA